MGFTIDVTVGYGECRSVRGHNFVPGLIYHKAPDCPPGETLFNVTHIRSGLAIVVHLQPGLLAPVKEIVARLDWSLLPEEFVLSEAHNAARKAIVQLTTKERSLRQENRLAKVLRGKRQPASGARWGSRRDVSLPRFLIEAKTTGSDNFRLDLKDLVHLRKQAFSAGKTPAYVIQLQFREELVIVPFDELTSVEMKGSAVVESTHYGQESVRIDLAIASAASLQNTAHVLETSYGRFVLISYERFLNLAKKDVDDED